MSPTNVVAGTNATATNGVLPNGGGGGGGLARAAEIESLLQSALAQLVAFLGRADDERRAHQTTDPSTPVATSIVDHYAPAELRALLTADDTLSLPSLPGGRAKLLQTLDSVLRYSVNTSAPGFLDKLYGAPLPPGIVAELVLACLNTNVHVYGTSPVLTVVETHVTAAFAALFGLRGPRAGGISVQGGSASNTTSVVVARNTLFPRTKVHGNSVDGLRLVMFTSAHGHYSLEKAAVQCGFGSGAVVQVPVDGAGRMDAAELEKLVVREKEKGMTPFYVIATAGTTVLGSFDPFNQIADVCKRHGMWMHVDGAWGGSFVFSDRLRERLSGVERADSIAVNPHKMMGVPLTCSFLLLKDMRQAQRSNTLLAGYLFHGDNEDEEDEQEPELNGKVVEGMDEEWKAPTDLADLTLQCGRRGDALKLFLSWQYYGNQGYMQKVDDAYDTACFLADLVESNEDLVLVSSKPPPCLQVCFYFAPGGKMAYEPRGDLSSSEDRETIEKEFSRVGKRNSLVTSRIAALLVSRGFMVDFAPPLEHEIWKGSFFRVVINISTIRETATRLVHEVCSAGKVVREALKEKDLAHRLKREQIQS